MPTALPGVGSGGIVLTHTGGSWMSDPQLSLDFYRPGDPRPLADRFRAKSFAWFIGRWATMNEGRLFYSGPLSALPSSTTARS